MPDLGPYAFEVLTSYAVTLAILVGLVGLYLLHDARTRGALDAAERRRKGDRDG